MSFQNIQTIAGRFNRSIGGAVDQLGVLFLLAIGLTTAGAMAFGV